MILRNQHVGPVLITESLVIGSMASEKKKTLEMFL